MAVLLLYLPAAIHGNTARRSRNRVREQQQLLDRAAGVAEASTGGWLEARLVVQPEIAHLAGS